MIAHVYTEWYKENPELRRKPMKIPRMYTKEKLLDRMHQRLNTLWELRANRLYQYLGLPRKVRNKVKEDKDKQLESYVSYVKAGGLEEEVSKFIILIMIFQYAKSMDDFSLPYK
jgi:hypothetical protein